MQMPSPQELVGLPKSFTIDEAKRRCAKFFQSLGWNVNKDDLNARHWVKNKQQVIENVC